VKEDQEIDNALADEFAGYLKSVSKEIVQPIRETVAKQKSEIDRLISSIDQAGTKITSELDSHREQLMCEGKSLLAQLDSGCARMEQIVSGVADANEVTRQRLLAEAAAISNEVCKSIDAAMASSVHAAEMRLHLAIEESIFVKLKKIDGPLMEIGKFRYWLIAICILQVATVAVIWLRG